MNYALARVGDSVSGTCSGDYKNWEQVGTTPIVTNSDGSKTGGDPIYDWVIHNETGTITGTISTGSEKIKTLNNVSYARIGDSVNITKTYLHSNHIDNLNVTGEIVTGSSKYFIDGLGIAYVGCSISADNVTGEIITGSQNVFIKVD